MNDHDGVVETGCCWTIDEKRIGGYTVQRYLENPGVLDLSLGRYLGIVKVKKYHDKGR